MRLTSYSCTASFHDRINTESSQISSWVSASFRGRLRFGIAENWSFFNRTAPVA